jgi:translocation and assembly module TamB
MRRALLATVALAPLVALTLAARADDDKGVLASFISRALSSKETQVSIGAVEGALSSDATIRDIVLSDRDGPWLKIDHARLVWRRFALLRRRLEIDQLDIGHVVWSRPAAKAAQTAPSGPMQWPDLPLKAIVKAFQVESLDLGAPILGEAARLGFTGEATLGSPSEGLDLKLAAKRLDAPGEIDVKLAFAPKTTQLALAFDAEEPQGGLIAKAAHLPGEPPVDFRLDGAGPLDAFHAKLAFSAGPDIGAKGTIDLSRAGAGRDLKLDLESRLAGLLPPLAAPVFAGQTQLAGDVRLDDDGAVKTQGVTLESAAAALYIVGGLGADKVADLTVHAHAKPGPDLGKLDLLATVKGPLPRPAAEVALDVEKLKSSAGTLGRLTAHFAALPAKPGDAAQPVALTGEADMADLALADAAQSALVGHSGKLAFQATATPDGALDVAALSLDAEALRARFAGKAAQAAVSGELSADAADLGRLAPLTGLKLKGAAHFAATLSGDPSHGAYAALVKAEAKGFGSGEAALDGFAGANPTLSGAVKMAGGGYAFDKLALTGAGGRALIDGALGASASNLGATLVIPDSHRLDARVAGAVAAEVKLKGPLSAPDADVKATLSDGRLLGRPAPRLALTAQVKGGAALKAKLDGEIDGKALQGDVSLGRAGDVVTLDRAAFSLGQTRIDGDGKFAKGLADGRLTIAAPRLDDLSPLALTPLSGSLQADARLDSQGGKQNAAIRAKSPSATFGAARLSGLDVDMRVADLYGDARADGSAAIEKIVAGGETVSGLKLAAKAGAFDLAASLRGMALRAKGALSMAARTLRLDAFTARGRGPAIALSSPATLAFADGGVATKGLAMTLGAGRLSLKGQAGRKLDLQAKAEAIPLSLADLASPGLGLTGTVSAEARITGEAAAPQGDWRITLAKVSAPAARSAGLPPLDAKASGRLAGTRTSLDATLSAGAAGSLRIAGSAPLKAGGPLDVKASGRLDIAPLTRTLAARGQRASGTLTLDARVTGDLAHPKASGSAVLTGGAFADEISGLRLTDLSATVAARGDEVEIAKASGHTPGGGTISASGRVRLDPAAGFPGAIKLRAENARLVATEIVTAEAGMALDLTGPLARDPAVAGRIDVKAIDVEIPGRLPGSDAPLADVRHIDPGPTARARLALMEKKRRAAGPGFSAKLALTVSAPSRVTVHGRGIDAEFGGRLQVKGTTVSPQIDGGFDIRRGTLTLIGGPMTFARGRVSFDGGATPHLDLEAQQTLSDATAIIDVTGPADKPTFTFSSNPQLPQDEILSRILFQKPSGNLSAFQALQLANTVSALSGNGGAFDSLRRSLGVDSLDVSSDANGGPVVGARRAISNRLSLGVSTGARPEDNGVSLDFDLTKRLRLSTGVDAKGESNLGAGLNWEY